MSAAQSPHSPFHDERILAEARRRRKADPRDAAAFLARELAASRISPEGLETVGRFLLRVWRDAPPESPPLRVLVLGQCTTAWLSPILTAVAWRHGAALDVVDGPYDNVLQELLTLASSGAAFDIVVLLPWNARLLAAGDRSPDRRVDDELAFWSGVWDAVGRLGARLVQVGYDLPGPGPSGYALGVAAPGETALVRDVNRALRASLPPRAYFVDLETVSALHGRLAFYNARRYFWTKQPFSESGAARLAQHVWAGIRALTVGPKKVLVLDLDNTLWGGVVGETGPRGIELGDSPLGEAFRAFQHFVKGLAARGILLAVASKNNPQDAREPFESHPDMVLRFDDFAAFIANWDPKALALERIARDLRLDLDSFVFFDDNPAEREHIRQALPQVAVVDVPDDPSDFIPALRDGLWFEAASLTDEDRARQRQYAAERDRLQLQVRTGSLEAYLRSLEMTGEVRPVDAADLPRVVQLLGKTNQFNLTTRRHADPQVRELLRPARSLGLTLRLRDRFGDHGLVSVILASPAPDDPEGTLLVDTWLMSCRVIGRTAEDFFFLDLLRRARSLGYQRLRAEYIPTPKNAPVRDLLPRFGFAPLESDGPGLLFQRSIGGGPALATYVASDQNP